MRSFFNLLLALPAALAAPILLQTRQEDQIANSWIVKVKQDALLSGLLTNVAALAGVQPTHTYDFGDFKGFSIDDVADAVDLLSSLTAIESIEPNTRVYTQALVTQQNPPYGLARISHHEPGSNEYVYDESAGQGTYAYIIDTASCTSSAGEALLTAYQGTYPDHVDFGGRASYGANFVPDEGPMDGNGHGTHVSGTTGSNTYGVAKKTNIIGVKVLSSEGSGTNAQVLAGIDWAANDMVNKGRVGKSVANLSLGGILSPMTNAAVAEAVRQGLFMAVAAGNNGLPTITASPASEPLACTVGATDSMDNRASFSNFGLLVDIFAPGVNVTSTWIDSNTDTNTISGTSMATPHITGLGAYLLALEGPRSPQALCSRIQELSTKGKIALPLGRNYLAYNGNGA